MTKVFKIKSIIAREGKFSPIYVATVYTPEATIRKGETLVPHTETTVECYFHFGRKEWMGRVVDMYRFLDTKMACVGKFEKERRLEVERQEMIIQAINSVAIYGLTEEDKKALEVATKKLKELTDPALIPCTKCRKKDICGDTNIFRLVPRVRLWEGASLYEMYKLASSVAGVVARVKDPAYPASLPADIFSGFRRCSDCKHCLFIKRDNDPDAIDPVQGVATVDSDSTEVHYVLGLCHPDRKMKRDMGEREPTMKCELLVDKENPLETGWIRWDDTCPSYVWKGYNAHQKFDSVNAYRHVEVTATGDIICGNAIAVGVYSEI